MISVIQLREDEATKGLAFLLFTEGLSVGFHLLLCEGVECFDGFSKLVSYCQLLLSRFARVRITDFTGVLCPIALSKIEIAMGT